MQYGPVRRRSFITTFFTAPFFGAALCRSGSAHGAQSASARPPAPPQVIIEDALDELLRANPLPPFVAVLDYRRHSSEPRFYLYETKSRSVLQTFIVAHGKGSDKDNTGYATVFSDAKGSLASSIGVFRATDTYRSRTPNHGLSLRLEGLSPSNRSAKERSVVIHANTYVERSFLKKFGRPGRSHGCMVFSAADRDVVVEKLRGGGLIYAIA